jgi:hypothetical protein
MSDERLEALRRRLREIPGEPLALQAELLDQAHQELVALLEDLGEEADGRRGAMGQIR